MKLKEKRTFTLKLDENEVQLLDKELAEVDIDNWNEQLEILAERVEGRPFRIKMKLDDVCLMMDGIAMVEDKGEMMKSIWNLLWEVVDNER
jgi:hypothetical protein